MPRFTSAPRTRIGLRRLLLLTAVWLVLTEGDAGAWLFGVVAVAGATLLSFWLLPPVRRTVRPLTVIGLLPAFLWDSLRGGIDVAARALDPRMPLNPGWIRYPLRLPPGPPRVSLGNMLSLMPGTLAAGSDGDSLCLHCLDLQASLGEQVAREEVRVAASVGLELDRPGAAD